MNLRTRLVKLEQKLTPLILIVIEEDQEKEEAIQQWCQSNQKAEPTNVLFVTTGVLNVGDDW
jgi:hypothetical protein